MNKKPIVLSLCIVAACSFEAGLVSAANRIYWGAWTFPNESALSAFESSTQAGKRVSIMHIGGPWVQGVTASGADNYQAFPQSRLQTQWVAGRLTCWTW